MYLVDNNSQLLLPIAVFRDSLHQNKELRLDLVFWLYSSTMTQHLSCEIGLFYAVIIPIYSHQSSMNHKIISQRQLMTTTYFSWIHTEWSQNKCYWLGSHIHPSSNFHAGLPHQAVVLLSSLQQQACLFFLDQWADNPNIPSVQKRSQGNCPSTIRLVLYNYTVLCLTDASGSAVYKVLLTLCPDVSSEKDTD